MTLVYATELSAPEDQLVGWGLKIVAQAAREAGLDVREVAHPRVGLLPHGRPDVWLLSWPYAGNLRYIKEFFEETAVDDLDRRQRDTGTRYIIGGHAVINPDPLLDVFDAAFVGEIDDVAEEVMEWVSAGGRRPPGIIEEPGQVVSFQLASSLDKRGFYKASYDDTKDNGVGEATYLEVARGCAMGCRFCELGWAYGTQYTERTREETEELIQGAVKKGVPRKQIVLSAPHTDGIRWYHEMVADGDYDPRWRSTTVYRYLKESDAQPSGRRGRIRFGVEGVSERLRVICGKKITNEDLAVAYKKAVREGYRMIRTFLIGGVPTETTEDRMSISDIFDIFDGLTGRGLRHWKSMDVKVTGLSPQPFTPWQRLGIRDSIIALREYRRVRQMMQSDNVWWRQVMVDTHSTEADVAKRMRPGELLQYLSVRDGGEPERGTGKHRGERWPAVARWSDSSGIDYARRVVQPISGELPWSNVVHPAQKRLERAERRALEQVDMGHLLESTQ